MAKLSARGRTEVARFELDRSKVTHPTLTTYDGTSYWFDFNREIITRALMSDGNVLQKRKVWFTRSNGESDFVHASTWRVKGRKRKDMTNEQWIETYTKGFWKRVIK